MEIGNAALFPLVLAAPVAGGKEGMGSVHGVRRNPVPQEALVGVALVASGAISTGFFTFLQ